LATLAQIACNFPSVSNVLSQTCSKVNLNARHSHYDSYFGGILLIMGLKGLVVVVVVKNSISSTPLLLAVSHSNR
jgi:hypothetical protein